jgi:Cu(I)/Ag(I) efflux system membrane protein CusA/SilA
MFTGGTGSQVMQRLATPMVGGLFSAALLTLVVLPAAYMLIQRVRLQGQLSKEPEADPVERSPQAVS